jgi:hypothetical protein
MSEVRDKATFLKEPVLCDNEKMQIGTHDQYSFWQCFRIGPGSKKSLSRSKLYGGSFARKVQQFSVNHLTDYHRQDPVIRWSIRDQRCCQQYRAATAVTGHSLLSALPLHRNDTSTAGNSMIGFGRNKPVARLAAMTASSQEPAIKFRLRTAEGDPKPPASLPGMLQKRGNHARYGTRHRLLPHAQRIHMESSPCIFSQQAMRALVTRHDAHQHRNLANSASCLLHNNGAVDDHQRQNSP